MFFHVITRTLCFILDFQKRPLSYLIWRLAAFWPKKLAPLAKKHLTGAPNDNFRKNICSEDDFKSRIFGTFLVKFLVCLPLLGYSNIKKMV